MFLKKNKLNSFSTFFIFLFFLPLIILARNYEQVFLTKTAVIIYTSSILFFFYFFNLLKFKFLNNVIFQILTIFLCIKFFFNSVELNFDGSKNLLENINYIKILLIDIGIFIFSIFLSFKLKEKNKSNLNYFLLIFLTINIFINSMVIMDQRNKEFNNFYSNDKNIILLVLDGFDANFLNYQINEDFKESKEIFKDFTYHKNTVANFFFTEYSAPSYLSGSIFDKTETYERFKETNKHKIIKLNPDFEKRFVLFKHICTFLDLKNCIDRYELTLSNQVRYIKSFFDIYDVYFTKIIPIFFLKKKNEIVNKIIPREKFTFLSNHFNSNPLSVDFLFKEKIVNDLKIKKEKQFIYYHFNLPHYPGEFDKNCTLKEDPSLRSLKWIDVYSQSVCIVKIMDEYFDFLKKNNLYDNSIIVVMSDHGSINKSVLNKSFLTDAHENFPPARANPILLTKGISRKNKQIVIDDNLKSLSEVRNYINLMLGGKSIDQIRERNVVVNYFQETSRRAENDIWEIFHVNDKVYTSSNWIPKDLLKFNPSKISILNSNTNIYKEYIDNRDSFSLYGWKVNKNLKLLELSNSASFYFHKLNKKNKILIETKLNKGENCDNLEFEIFNRGKKILSSKLDNENIIINDESFIKDYNLLFMRTNKNLLQKCIQIKNLKLI